MGPGLQDPVGTFLEPSPGKLHHTARFDLPQSPEYTASGCSGRSYTENLPEAVQIGLGVNQRMGKQGLWLRAENKGIFLHGIE